MRYKMGGGRASYSRIHDLQIKISIARSVLGIESSSMKGLCLEELELIYRALYDRLKAGGHLKD